MKPVYFFLFLSLTTVIVSCKKADSSKKSKPAADNSFFNQIKTGKYGMGMTIDQSNNIYVAGGVYSELIDTVDFGSIQAISRGGNNIFIVKYDDNGKTIWLKF